MKRIVLSCVVSLFVMAAHAQDEKFIAAMSPKVVAIDTTSNPAALLDLANAFERIANAEKKQWLPFYYAALATVKAGYSYSMTDDVSPVIALADKADAFLTKAASLTSDNSELHCVKKMIITLRVKVEPMTYYNDIPTATAELEKAKKLNPENPRVYLLDGQDKYYTPAQFGGDKELAKVLFAEAVKKFETFKPATPIDPNWGANQAKYFAGLAGK